jgi:hypothetical protein
VTFLYNTLHYYEKRLRERTVLKRRLVAAVLGYEVGPRSSSSSQPAAEAPAFDRLSDEFKEFVAAENPSDWSPGLSYYVGRVANFVKSEFFLLMILYYSLMLTRKEKRTRHDAGSVSIFHTCFLSYSSLNSLA